MSKAVMISIRPEWCEKIGSGEKTIEVRKTRPKLPTPFKCYIYETQDEKYKGVGLYNPDAPLNKNFLHYPGNVIGEFVCDTVYSIDAEHVPALKDAFHSISCDDFLRKSCLSAYDLLDYLTASERQISIEYRPGYGWHISNLVIYDEPKMLSEFYRLCEKDVGDCWECPHSVGEEYDCGVNRRLYIKRPPQSWCLVEEL